MGVCVERDELNAVHAEFDHSVDGVTARAADTDDLDAGASQVFILVYGLRESRSPI
ncbi:MAG: hypothetical protein M5U21_00005 [Fimbriimonadaceae bacterium]|nr:hypothetical protein [Fimbriimonadaceae bacterium]